MKTSAFLESLRPAPDLPLVFQHGRHHFVPPGYHLTEVKRVAFETMDCGAQSHRWNETHFELWAPPGAEPDRPTVMPAGKFLRIVDVVEKKLPLRAEAEAKIYFGDEDFPAAIYSVDSVTPANGHLVVRLTADLARCKARGRQLAGAAAPGPAATAGTAGCCGAVVGAPATEAAACGCG